jgi:RimJ/RimL family protein N-acetyltransferase
MEFPWDVPRLTDGVVVLRAHTPADIPGVLEQCTDPVSRRWTTVPVPYTLEHARSFVSERVPAGWRDGTSSGFAIEAADAAGVHRFAGTVELRPEGAGAAEIAFGLHPWARGQGIARRACNVLLDWGFLGCGLTAVHWRANVGNWASRRVAWSLGFTFHGEIRAWLPQRGALCDGWAASLLADEPRVPRTAWEPIPVIRGERITLRPWREADAGRVTEACSDEVTQHWLWMLPSPYTRDAALWYIRRHTAEADTSGGLFWCIADSHTDECLGNVSLMLKDTLDPTMREVGYWLHPAARSRGIMTEAVAMAVRHAFIPLDDGGYGLRRLTLLASAGNVASQQVAIRAGFTHVGTARRSEPMRDGGYDDLRHYDLLADEWRAAPTQ